MSETALPPLSERIVAVEPVPSLAHQDVASWRPASIADRDLLMVFFRAMDGVDHPTWVTPWEDIEADLEGPGIDAELDTVVAVDAAGAVIGYQTVTPASSPETKYPLYLHGGVHPDFRGRGIGRVLLGWGRARAMQRLSAMDTTLPAAIVTYQMAENAAAVRLAERFSLVPERYFTAMERVLADPVPVIELPHGYRITEYTSDDAEATRLARNDAFRDHWGSQPSSPDRWAKFVGGELFRTDLSYVVRGPDDAIVAFALGSVNEEDWAVQGFSSVYIDLIGVAREHRGRRLAPAAIAALLNGARAAGLDRAILDVDTESPTGANTLYERLGFVATERSVALSQDF